MGTGTTPFFPFATGAALSLGVELSDDSALFLLTFALDFSLAFEALVTFAGLTSSADSPALLFFALTFFKTRLRAGAAMLYSFHVLPK